MVLRMSWVIDFAGQADVPLAVNMNVSKMVALKTGLRVSWMVSVKRPIDWYPVYSSHGQDFLVQLHVLNSQLYGGRKR